jgi:hypothetical protein
MRKSRKRCEGPCAQSIKGTFHSPKPCVNTLLSGQSVATQGLFPLVNDYDYSTNIPVYSPTRASKVNPYQPTITPTRFKTDTESAPTSMPPHRAILEGGISSLRTDVDRIKESPTGKSALDKELSSAAINHLTVDDWVEARERLRKRSYGYDMLR